FKSSASEISRTVEHRRIAGVRRIGKHIVIDLEAGKPARPKAKDRSRSRRAGPASTSRLSENHGAAQWIVHLGMTGRMLVCPPEQDIEKHTHAIAKLGSGRELRFVDPRRFGRLSVARQADFRAAGDEPLQVELERFVQLFHRRKTPIKSALLNQTLLSG